MKDKDESANTIEGTAEGIEELTDEVEGPSDRISTEVTNLKSTTDSHQFQDEISSVPKGVPEDPKDNANDTIEKEQEGGVAEGVVAEEDKLEGTILKEEEVKDHKFEKVKMKDEEVKEEETKEEEVEREVKEREVKDFEMKDDEVKEKAKESKTKERVKEEEVPEDLRTAEVSSPIISTGPYSLVNLIKDIPTLNQEIEETTGAVATAIESWELNIYVGTSKGELLHFFKLDDEIGYMLISRQRISTKTLAPVKKIVIIPSVSRALVLCNSAVSCFMMPEMSPANIGKVKDVQDISLDINLYQLDQKSSNKTIPTSPKNEGVTAVLYTSKSLRFVLITSNSMKLLRDMNYPNIKIGIRSSNLSLIGTTIEYNILDLEKGKKTVLFPISSEPHSSLHPIAISINSKEFLLACGGGKLKDPAIGMIVNTMGDVSRGTISWDKYPSTFICDYPHIIASFENELQVHSVQNQKFLQSLKFGNKVRVATVSHLFHKRFEDIVEIIRLTPLATQENVDYSSRIEEEQQLALKFANVTSSSLIYSAEEGVQLLLPTPMLKRVLQLIEGSHLETIYDDIEDEIRAIDSPSEYGTIQLKFSRLASCLTLLNHFQFDRAFDYFIDNNINPRIAVYLFATDLSLMYGEIWVYNGLKIKLQELRDKIQKIFVEENPNDDEMVLKFAMDEFYKMVIKNYFFKKSSDIELSSKHSVQVIHFLNELDSTDFTNMEAIDQFVRTFDVQFSSKEVIDQLNKLEQYMVLAAFYNSIGEYNKVVDLLINLGKGLLSDSKFNQIFSTDDELSLFLVTYIVKNINDEDSIWQYGQWLMGRSPRHAFELFSHLDLKAEISELKVIRMLDSKKLYGLMIEYLEVLLLDRNEIQFIGDMIFELLRSILEKLREDKNLTSFKECIKSYKDIESPKLTFARFVTIYFKQDPDNSKLFELHNHLFNYILVASSETTTITRDPNVSIIKYCQQELSVFSDQLPYLMCLIDFKLDNKHECVAKLCSLTDYKTAEFVATMLTIPYNLPNNHERIDKFIGIHRSKTDTKSIEDLEDEDATLAVRSIANASEGDEGLKESLLLQIFEKYLQLNNFKLIESFFNSHHLFDVSLQEVDGLDKMFDRFELILTKLPASFPVTLINRFLVTSLITFRDADLDKVKQKNLEKAVNRRLKSLIKDLFQ